MTLISTIKRLINNKDYLKLLENFFSLSVLNIVGYLFPLILIPYLTRVLGVEKFGLYAFSFALIQYFTILVNYGFDYSATKYISINREDREKISFAFYSILFIRLVIAFICVVLILILTSAIDRIGNEYSLYIYGVGIFIGQAITPIWLFQGMEQMKYVTIINFVAKLTSTILILIFIKKQSDYIYMNLFYISKIGY